MLEHLGSETLIYSRSAASDLLTIATQSRPDVTIGDTLTARFPASAALIFGADGKRIY
jgi:lactose/L-arabinose transport system ATP-binding protein